MDDLAVSGLKKDFRLAVARLRSENERVEKSKSCSDLERYDVGTDFERGHRSGCGCNCGSTGEHKKALSDHWQTPQAGKQP